MTTQTNGSVTQYNRTVTLQTFQTINAFKCLTISNACVNHNKNQTTVTQFETFQSLKQHEFNYTGLVEEVLVHRGNNICFESARETTSKDLGIVC